MLRTRVITAVVLLAILLPVLFSGSVYAVALMGLAFMAAACWEWARIVKLEAGVSIATAAVFALFCVLGAFWMQSTETTNIPVGLTVAITVFWMVVVPIWIIRPSVAPFEGSQWGLAVLGLAILACAWMSLCILALSGPVMLLSALAIVWISDIAAFFVGRKFGRHKLAPLVSPGKTWEGVVGAMLACLVTVFAVGSIPGLPPNLPRVIMTSMPWGAAACVICLLVALGIVGDLFESLLKRRAGVKDSSGLLPGHGGVFDRIDAILPVLPLAMLINLLHDKF
jgi:phosphatidate cytidylyltransferase